VSHWFSVPSTAEFEERLQEAYEAKAVAPSHWHTVKCAPPPSRRWCHICVRPLVFSLHKGTASLCEDAPGQRFSIHGHTDAPVGHRKGRPMTKRRSRFNFGDFSPSSGGKGFVDGYIGPTASPLPSAPLGLAKTRRSLRPGGGRGFTAADPQGWVSDPTPSRNKLNRDIPAIYFASSRLQFLASAALSRE